MKPLPAHYKIDRKDAMDSHYESTFLNKNQIIPVLLEPGDKLWRVVSTQKGRRFSDFWMDQDTMRSIMSIFSSWGIYSEDIKKAVVRDSVAILDAWKSNVSWRCQVTLLKEVVGYKGQTGPQKHFTADAVASEILKRPVEHLSEFKIGGFDQIVIPRFKNTDDLNMEQFGRVSHFARL